LRRRQHTDRGPSWHSITILLRGKSPDTAAESASLKGQSLHFSSFWRRRLLSRSCFGKSSGDDRHSTVMQMAACASSARYANSTGLTFLRTFAGMHTIKIPVFLFVLSFLFLVFALCILAHTTTTSLPAHHAAGLPKRAKRITTSGHHARMGISFELRGQSPSGVQFLRALQKVERWILFPCCTTGNRQPPTPTP